MTIEEMQHKLSSLVDENMELKNELKTYQKALELACEGMGFNYCKNCYLEHRHGHCSYCNTKGDSWVDYYLQKVREEE